MKLKYIALSVLLVLAAINFARTTLEIVKSSKKLDNIKNDITLLEQEKVALEKSITYKKSDAFIEKTARNELNMAKPGESVYVVSGLSENDANDKKANSVVAVQKVSITMDERIKNLKLWLRFLF